MATGGEIGGVEEPEAGSVPGLTNKQQPDVDTGSTDDKQESDAVREYTCSACSQNDVTTVATHFCPECNVCYCKACLCDHVVMGRSKVAQWGKADTEGTGSHTQAEVEENTCLRHPGHVVTMYCVDHDVLCCQLCSSTDHRPCKDMDTLSVAAENDDLDDTVQNVEAKIASLERNTETLANDSERRSKFVESSHTNYANQLEKMKKKLFAKFDKATIEALERKQHYINKFNTDKQVCTDITEKLTCLKRTLKPTEDKQKGFIRVKRAQEWVRDKQEEMGTILTAKVTDVFQNISCEEEARALDVVTDVIDVRMAEMKFSTETPEDEHEGEIVGLCQIASGHIIIADKANICLKHLDEYYTVISQYKLPDTPRAISAAGDTEVAVVMDNQKIIIVSVGQTFENVFTLELDHPCANVAYHNENLYVTNTPPCPSHGVWCCCKTQVHIYDKSGIALEQMTAAIGQHKNSTYDNGTPICISEDGEKIFVAHRCGLVAIDSEGGQITSSKDYKGITWLCVDGSDNVYASKGDTKEVIILSQEDDDFEHIETVTSSLEEATTPGPICFDKRLDRIVICEKEDSYIYLEKTTYLY